VGPETPMSPCSKSTMHCLIQVPCLHGGYHARFPPFLHPSPSIFCIFLPLFPPWVDDILSNAPYMLRQRVVMVRHLLWPISILCVRAIVVLMVDYWGWPLIWSGYRRSWVSTILLSLETISFSRTIPRQFNKAIGQYTLGLL
jgi:hypothetical protein